MYRANSVLAKRGLAFVDSWNAPHQPTSAIALDFSLLSVDTVIRILVTSVRANGDSKATSDLLLDISCYLALLLEQLSRDAGVSFDFAFDGEDVFLQYAESRHCLSDVLRAFVEHVREEIFARKRYSEFELINQARSSLFFFCRPDWAFFGTAAQSQAHSSQRNIGECAQRFFSIYSESCVQWLRRTSPTVVESQQPELYRSIAVALCANTSLELEECFAQCLRMFRSLGYGHADCEALARSWSGSSNPLLALFSAVLLHVADSNDSGAELSAAILKRLGIVPVLARRLLIRAREEFDILEDWILAEASNTRLERFRREYEAGFIPQLFLSSELLCLQHGQEELRLLFQAIAEGNAERALRLCITLAERSEFREFEVDLGLQAAHLHFVLGRRVEAFQALLNIRRLRLVRGLNEWRYYLLRAMLEQAAARPRRAACYYKRALRVKGIDGKERARLCSNYAELLSELGQHSAAVQLHSYSAYLRGRPTVKGLIGLLTCRLLRFNSAFEREMVRALSQDEQIFSVVFSSFFQSRYAGELKEKQGSQQRLRKRRLQANAAVVNR